METRPTLNQIFSQNQGFVQNRPELSEIFAQKPQKSETEARMDTSWMPTKEDIPGLVSSVAHGATLGATNVGRESYEKAIGGYPGEFMARGMDMAKNAPQIARQFMLGGPTKALQGQVTPLRTANETIGIPVLPEPKTVGGKVLGQVIEMGTGALTGKYTPKIMSGTGKVAKDTAVGISKKIINPTGRYAKGTRGDQIAETALEEGILSASPRKVAQRSQDLIDQYMDEVDALAQSAPGTINTRNIINRGEALARGFEKVGDNVGANAIRKKVEEVAKARGWVRPATKLEETSQFTLNKPGKLTTPKVTEIRTRDLPKKKPTAAVGADVQSVGKRYVTKNRDVGRVVVPEKGALSLSNPSARVTQQDPKFIAKRAGGNKAFTVTPETQYSIRKPVMGVSNKVMRPDGMRYSDISIKKGLGDRRAIDAHLKSIAPEGGYYSERKPAKVLAEQELAGSLRREYGRMVPEIAEKNRRVSKLIDLANVAMKRDAVTGRNNVFDLYDHIGALTATVNPKALAYLAPKFLWKQGKGRVGQGLYDYSKFALKPNTQSAEEQLAALGAIRALMAQ